MSRIQTLVAATLLTLALAAPAAAQFQLQAPQIPFYEIQWPPQPSEVWLYAMPYQFIYDEDEIYYDDSCGQDCDDYVVMTPSYSAWGNMGGFLQIEFDANGYDPVWAIVSDDGDDFDTTTIWTHPDDEGVVGVTLSTAEFAYDYHDYVSPVVIIIFQEPNGGDYHYIRISVSQHWAPWLP